MASKLHVKKGDSVVVIAGASNGKSGKILAVDTKKGRVKVEGLNIRKKAIRRTQDNPTGGIVEMEGFMDVSNVMLQSKYDARKSNK